MEGVKNMANLGDEFKSSGITQDTPKNVMLGAGTIHKGLEFGNTYVLLTVEPIDWSSGYTKYFTKSGQDYTAVAGESAPPFATDTYYEKRMAWNFEESLVGATSGGTKVSIKPEFMDVEVDGALVKVKGLAQKVGETATMETNIVEVKPEVLQMTLVGNVAESADKTGYSEITSKPRIEEGDYLKNLAYVGKTLEGKPIIIIFENALCTSGFEIEGKNKENVVLKATFECYANLTTSCDTLPYHIYYPTPIGA